MYVTNTFNFEGYRITHYKGIVRGIVVRVPTIGQGLSGAVSNIFGGVIPAYTAMCEQARQEAFDAMVRHANELQANAIVAVRYDTSEVNAGAAEVLCYGTAVVIEKSDPAV